MTMPTENIAVEPGLVCRGLHIHTLTKRGPRYAVRTGFSAARFDPPVQPGRMRPLPA
jgi:hypothetical protein